MGIPKIIIQTWKCKDLPPYYKKTQNLILRHNPDYRYIFFDDQDILRFIKERYPSFEPLLKKFKRKIQIIDFFRLLAVYEYGGFYFDMDVEVIDKLDSLLDNSCVFPVEMKRNNRILKKIGYDYNLGNYAFAATPRNPVIWAIIEEIVKVIEDPHRLVGKGMHPKLADMISEVSDNSEAELSHEYVYHTTGPVIVSKVVFDALAGGKSVKLLYPKNWPSRSSWFRFGKYAKHTMTGTWKPDRVGIINSSESDNGLQDMKNTDSSEDVTPEKESEEYKQNTVLSKVYEGLGLKRVWSSLSVEHMTVSDMVSDPETVLILVLITAVIIIFLILCSLSLIGCDDEVVIE
jgi:mannosyltransferase OCH1-like enzyme